MDEGHCLHGAGGKAFRKGFLVDHIEKRTNLLYGRARAVPNIWLLSICLELELEKEFTGNVWLLNSGGRFLLTGIICYHRQVTKTLNIRSP